MSEESPKIGLNRRGNAGKGRPKGSPNRLTKTLKSAILEAFRRLGGADYLVEVGKEDRRTFLTLLGRIVPSEVKKDDGGEKTLEQLLAEANRRREGASEDEREEQAWLVALRAARAKAGPSQGPNFLAQLVDELRAERIQVITRVERRNPEVRRPVNHEPAKVIPLEPAAGDDVPYQHQLPGQAPGKCAAPPLSTCDYPHPSNWDNDPFSQGNDYDY